MKCQIGEAIEKIDKLISNNSKVDDNTINQLIKVKKKLNSVKDIRMSRMQSNNTGSESKTLEFDKKGFNGYVSIKDTGGKVTPEGDAKDKAMREVANGFIGEFAYRAGVNTPVSSTLTSVKTIANKDKSSPSAFGNSNTISYIPKNTSNNIDGFTYNSGYYYSKEHIKKTYKITGSSYGKKEDNSNTVPKILAKELVKFMQSIQSDSDVSEIIDYLGENKNNEKNAVDTRGHKLHKDVIELLPKLAKAVRNGQAGGEKYNSISMKEDIDNLFVLLDLGKDLVKKIIEDTPFKLIQDNSYEKDYYSIGSRYIDGLTAGSDVLSVKTVMLAKNSNNRFKESYPEDSYKKFAETLREFTKELIDEAHNSGATFVVGDMPGVDTQFIEYLNKIGASYKVYTTNEAGKEFDRKGIDGSKYRNIVETKSQVETKSLEPEIKYGSVVKYKPENGIEGYYIVRGFSSNGGLQLTDSEGKNFSGTPKIDKVKFAKQLEIKRYNNVDYIIDSNNRVYTQNGRVANSYENRLLNEFGINKQKQNENEIIKENKNTIKENKSVNKYELFPGVYANEDQENAIDDIKDWYKSNKSNTYLLKGRGGTGKTTIVGEVIKQLGIDNRRVVFSAFSNKAVKVLSNSNKDNEYKDSKYLTTAQILKLKPVRDAKTGKQKFVVDAYADEKLTSSDKIIVIDEASMLPNKQQKEIEAKAKNLGIKIIYMGDDVQLPPVDEFDINGKAVKEALVFNEHKKTGDVSELTKRMRQKGESPILPVTDVLANSVKNEIDPNKIVFEQGTEINNGQGVVFLNKNAGELDIMEMFLKDFKKDQEGTKYIHYNASDNPKTISKNNIIRRELYGEDFNLPENKYMVGEQVIFDNGYFYQDERTGDNVSIDGATEAKVLESDIIKNKPINYFHGRQKRTIKLDVYSVKVQENDSSGIGYIHNIDIPFNLNRLEEIIKEEQKDLGVYPGGLKDAFASISYSYVITSHKSQGSTYNNAYVDIGNIFGIKATDNDTKLKSAYVATSRPRHKLVMIGANTNGKTVSVDEAIELIKEDSQAYNLQSEPGVDPNNKYKTISKDDIEAAKDIMSNNKKECE